MRYDIEKYKQRLITMLSPKRCVHSLGVAETARKLAEQNGADAEKAYAAGLLHDVGKGYDYREMLDLCEKYGIELDDVSRQSEALIHAPLGAEIAVREFGVDDEEILESIRRHTVGGEGMTVFDKIIYIADMIEPNRAFEGAEEIRKAAFEDLDSGVLMGVDSTIIHTVKKGQQLHPSTLYMRNELIRKRDGKQ